MIDYKYVGYAKLLCIIAVFSLVGCVTTKQKAYDAWRKAIETEKYSVFSPIRSNDELGNIITFDSKEREIIIARRATCLPNLTSPDPYSVEFISSSDKLESSSKISGSVANMLKGKVDLSFLANSDSVQTISLKLSSPQVIEYETLLLKKEIEKLDRNSACYKALAKPGNLLVYNVLIAKGVAYTFKDHTGRKLKIDADLLTQAKVSPELKKKSEGKADLIVDYPITIGYRAIEFRELPGLIADRTDFRIVDPAKIEEMRNMASGQLSNEN